MSWFVDRVLPGVIDGQILLTIAYVRLHFEKKWPYWGRTRRDDENEDL